MVQKYTILGQQVASHYLAIGVLSSMFAGVYLSVGGKSPKQAQQGPAINAGSKDEENFIQNFLKENEGAKH